MRLLKEKVEELQLSRAVMSAEEEAGESAEFVFPAPRLSFAPPPPSLWEKSRRSSTMKWSPSVGFAVKYPEAMI